MSEPVRRPGRRCFGCGTENGRQANENAPDQTGQGRSRLLENETGLASGLRPRCAAEQDSAENRRPPRWQRGGRPRANAYLHLLPGEPRQGTAQGGAESGSRLYPAPDSGRGVPPMGHSRVPGSGYGSLRVASARIRGCGSRERNRHHGGGRRVSSGFRPRGTPLCRTWQRTSRGRPHRNTRATDPLKSSPWPSRASLTELLRLGRSQNAAHLAYDLGACT
jgi:hypothetical protein